MRDLIVSIVVLTGLLIGWYGLNRWVLEIYPEDASEGGRLTPSTD